MPRQKSVVHILMKNGTPCDERIEVTIPARRIGMRQWRRRPSLNENPR
jgi:hypothetical protein